MKELLARLSEHAHWANRSTLASLQQAGVPPPEAVRLFAHVLTAERIYLERIKGLDPWPQDFWPDLSLGFCSRQVQENHDAYSRFLSGTTEEALLHQVRYRNSKGAAFETPMCDMLLHVALHGEHHRGQIAKLLRQSGAVPAVTDFITFVRDQGPDAAVRGG
jgi:uncharacterized damage-inducible protein DinB